MLGFDNTKYKLDLLIWIIILSQDVCCNARLVERGAPSSLPPDVLMVSIKVNASTMTCGQAVIMPNLRMVQLDDPQMKELMQNKGGNYLHDYMAATEEEARENFPNLLLITDPSQDIYGNTPMSVYDNFMAKNVLMEDLNRIKFYMLNTTMSNGRPDMGMYIINNTNSANKTMSENNSTKTDIGSTSQNVGDLNISNISNKFYTTQTTLTADGGSNSGINKNISKNSNVSDKDNQTSRGGGISSTDKFTSSVTNFLTTLGYIDKLSNKGSTVSTNGYQTDGTTSSPGSTSDTNTADTATLAGTTMDPDVQKSLAELNKYLQGFGGGGPADMGSIIRAVNTTLSPEHLLRLANSAKRRKRNTDGTITTENYCQMKGSLTDDNQYVHLCSSCAATTKLSEDFFPRYINEVVCKTGDMGCFKIGQTVHGKCRQRYFTLNILRKSPNHCMTFMHNGERLVMEDWQLVPKRIRVSCECTINKLSFLKPYVAQDTPVG